MTPKPETPTRSVTAEPGSICFRIALLLSASLTVARFLTTENVRRWIGYLGDQTDSAPGPVATLCFVGLGLLAFCFWLAGLIRTGRMMRWPICLVLSLLVMASCTLLAAGLAGQRRIATHMAADWIVQWLMFLMLLDLLRSQGFRRVLLSAILATAALVAVRCIYQVHAEFPETLAGYEKDPAQYLRKIGTEPGTARAIQFEERIRQGQATGYLAAGNVTASVLILSTMAALGLAADRFFNMRRKFSRAFGVILLGLAGLTTYAIVLTGSRGATVGLAVGVLLFVGYLVIKKVCRAKFPGLRLRRHYRTLALGVGGLVVAATLAVIGCGMRYDSLGVKTLTYRWHYWVGSAGVFAEHPFFGVGPGNFKYHYAAHKLPEAVEEVANPHNSIVQMFTETGLLGGTALVVCVACIFILATRPREMESSLDTRQTKAGPMLRPLVWLGLLVVGSFALRTAVNSEGASLVRILTFQDRADDMPLLVLGLLAPAAVWVIAYLIAACDSDDLTGRDLPSAPLLRIAVICGLAGFVLHNQITFAIFHGAGGLMFWALAAMAIAMHPQDQGREYQLSPLDKYVMGAGAAAGLLLFGLVILLPAVRQAKHLDDAMAAYRLGAKAKLIGLDLNQAAEALPSDPWPDIFAARVLAERGLLDRAIQHQRRAVSLSPHDWTVRGHLADLLALRAAGTSADKDWITANTAFRRAIACYPTSTRLHESFADAYAQQNNWSAAVEHYQEALKFDEAKKIDAKYQWPPDKRRQVQSKLQEAFQKLASELIQDTSPQ